MALLQSLNK